MSYSDSYEDILNKAMLNAGNATNSDVRHGRALSESDLLKSQLEYAKTLEERSYNEQLYNSYESPAAMVRQYQEAGLNPMMLAGGSSVGGSVNATNSGSMSLGRGNESARGMDIMSMIFNAILGAAGKSIENKNATSSRISADASAAKAASDVEVNNAEIDKKKAETNLVNKQAEALQIDVNWKDKMYQIQYEVIKTDSDMKKLQYEYEQTYGWRAREAELDKLASEIKVNEATFEKLTADAWRTYQITPEEVKHIRAMVDKINSEKAMVDLEQAGQILENQESALSTFAHQVCTDYGINPSQLDLVAQGMYYVVQRQNDAMTDEEFAKKMTVLSNISNRRGKGDRAKGCVSTVTGAVGSVVGSAAAAYAGAKGAKGSSPAPKK